MSEEIRIGGHVIGDHGWEAVDTTPEDPGPPPEAKPADLKVDEVLELVGDDPAKAAEALAAEKAGKGRKTLLAGLEAVIEGGEE